MNNEMKNKTVLITGATSMIGTACTHLFANEYYKLMLIGRSAQKLEQLAKNLTAHVETSVTDMCSESAVQSMVDQTMASFGRIDAVIHNVAIYPWKSIAELDLSGWKQTLDTNLTGAFLATKACARIMQKQRSGKIVFMSSIAGETIGLPNMSAYAASKAGLNGLMRTAAIELAPYNITVNSISPGKMYDSNTLNEEEQRIKLLSVPLKRFIDPMDIAEMALFLISDNAKNITGQNFIIDGGQSVLGEDTHANFMAQSTQIGE